MSSAIGTRLAIATGLPATFDEAGYEALTWAEIGGLVDAGAIGDEDESVEIPNVTTGRTRVVRGAKKGMRTRASFVVVTGDAGQAAVIAAAATTNEFSFRVSDPGQTAAPEYYVSGPVFNLQRNERSTTSYLGMSFEFADNYGIVSGT